MELPAVPAFFPGMTMAPAPTQMEMGVSTMAGCSGVVVYQKVCACNVAGCATRHATRPLSMSYVRTCGAATTRTYIVSPASKRATTLATVCSDVAAVAAVAVRPCLCDFVGGGDGGDGVMV
jgi:hypothetical protein